MGKVEKLYKRKGGEYMRNMIITSLATLLLTLSAGTMLSANSNTSFMGDMGSGNAMVGTNTAVSAGVHASEDNSNTTVSSSANVSAGLGAMLNL